ncbi:efflux RND transporter periplasmic adaptor subunit [Flavobacterium branchiophilum]|uniref:MexH family multidrug efflux RND transporter periplasmic adaptor subunit n=2 Tax=Flavobacterium branchiophilum TaxID=55197 RepID=A0A2H3KB80_9FLAO|nr:efflux RND transporter periplasmic adaptor subunit [Flavobacterium branchiophilum]PDS24164.1 MexH family multidrug efflux RND transporter periplasmic adaptor subunit [Flavobacterium branchiophilum]CCB70443.1 Probable membrane fusion efflux protein [Flavobacterium branchiophilum FL-15]
MKLKNIILGFIILGLGGLIVFRIQKNSNSEDKGKDKSGKKPAAKVMGIVLKSEVFNDDLMLSGALEASEQIEIHSEISGIVTQIFFQEGSQVAQGQLLFKINDVEINAMLQQAKTKAHLAAENERRAKLLLQKEAISQEEYEIANADLKSAQAQTQLVAAQKSKTLVKAPFSGKIGLRNISPGTYITPSVLVANLLNTDQLKLTFSIPEKYASRIQNKVKLQFSLANDSQQYQAQVYALEPQIEANTRTLKVRAKTTNIAGKLMAGAFVTIQLPLDVIDHALLIPTEAVVPFQGGKKVYIANNGQAKEVKITTATRTDSSVLVLSGLHAGDTLVTTGVMALKDEAPIKVMVK